MDMQFLVSFAVLYIAAKIGEKLVEQIGNYVVGKIGEYVVGPIGHYVLAPIEDYLVAPVRDYLVAPIRRQLCFLLCYNGNIEDFRTQIEKLRNMRDEVQGLVDAAEGNCEVVLPKVQKWITNANEIIRESQKIFDDHLPVNLKGRYHRSRIAKEKATVADGLRREASSFDRVSTSAEMFESRRLIFRKIMEALTDDEINMIGVYGMAGVGKSTLAKAIVQQAIDDNLFDAVVMTGVSQTPNLGKIQLEIVKTLDQNFEKNGESRRAGQICTNDKKRVLIILDDIWERVELEAVGIPFGVMHKGCKVVLTSRSQDVCNQMDTDKNFLVEVLSDEEGWNLFRKMADESVDSPDLRDLAYEVAKECGGLPMAIVTVARALKRKSFSDWRDARNQLRKSIPSKKVFSTLELSYRHLESDEAKSFFLLCCLFPEDWNIEIQDLMKYGMGLGLFHDVDTVDEARARAHKLANDLKSSCLLLDSGDKEHVKIHDVVRDVAISIASKDKHVFLVRAGPGWKEFPKKDTFGRYTAISLNSDDIHELPGELKCPQLQILLFKCPHPLLQFPNNFFCGMENLKVLDMSGMHFSSLPSSLRYLKNLRTLCLNRCTLKDVSIIGELKKLEILSFLRSNIKQLPQEIGTLTHLRLLDLARCEELTIIPPNIILGLSQLEGLYMDKSFHDWETERQDKERSNASLAELKHLSHLINLEIRIPDADLLPKDLLFENLSRFKISIGTSFGRWDRFSYLKILKLELNLSTSIKDGVKGLLKEAEHLHLKKMKGLKSVAYDLDTEGFRHLRCLNVEHCCEVEYIFNASERVSPVAAFPVMEKLDLDDLPNLKEICHGQLPSGFFCELQELSLRSLPKLISLSKDPAQHVCFHSLTAVKVVGCRRLKNLFAHYMAKDLSNLVELEVSSCKIMEEIVGNEKEEATDDIVFPHLRCLELRTLPNLRNFCSKKKSLAMKGDLDTHSEEPLFHEKVAFPALEKLIIESILYSFNFKEIWHPQLTAKSFSQLKILKVDGCHKVLNLIPFNLLQRLRSLEEFTVENCDSVEEVVEVEGLVVEEGHLTETLSQLRKLRLWRLPKLKHIMWWDKFPHGTLGFQNLSSINIYQCNSLKSLFSPSVASNLVRLQVVEVESCEMMELIMAKESHEEENCMEIIVFPQLHTLKLQNLPKLINFIIYSGRCTLNWPSLKVLWILGCPTMKTFTSRFSIRQKSMIDDDIFKEAPHEGGNLHDRIHPLFDKKVSLPSLEVLKIKGLDNLKDIWHPQLPVESFCHLKVLEVQSCHKLLNVVSSNMLKGLKNLEEVSVKECDSVEIIFEVEWLTVKGMNGTGILSQLRELELWGLPKLFASKNPILQKLEMKDEEVEKKPEERNSCIPIRPLFDEWVAFTNLEVLRIINIENLQEIFPTELPDKSFSQLKYLLVRGCHKLSRVAPSNLLPRLKNLEELIVEGCNSIKKIFELEGHVGQGYSATSLFQLEKVELRDLSDLKIFFSDNYNFDLPSLETLSLIVCPKMWTFSSGFISTPKLNTVTVEQNEQQWKGDLNSTVQHLFQEKQQNKGRRKRAEARHETKVK